jgi:hypothetical protein
MVFAFLWCSACIFEIHFPAYHDDSPDFNNEVIPKEPFVGQIRELFATNKDFKDEWMGIMSTMWKSSQYMDNEPEVEPTHSDEFINFYPHHQCLDAINAALATFESHKTELTARRVDLLRSLAHLHAATAGKSSPSNPAPHHAPPDGAGRSNKRKLDAMATLLERWVIG